MASRTQERRVVKLDVLVVGIDVAKGRHVASMRHAGGFRMKPFGFCNDRSGFEDLVARTESTRESQKCRSVLFALEATGHYGHALRYFLTDRGYAVVGINPAHTKKAKELEDNSPEKSDRKDAEVIADLAVSGKGRLLVALRGVFADLRRLGKMRERLVVERIRLRNRYLGVVDLLFPELSRLVRDVACRSVLRLLAECPTPRAIRRLGLEELQARLRSWSRGHIDGERSARIYQAAVETVGLQEGLEAACLEMKQTLSALREVEARLKEVERAQARSLRRVPYADQLLSVPGLGPVTVATILGETGDLRNYRHADAVIKFAGYNLYTISSGTLRGKTHITKRGRPLLRRHLFLAACRLSKRAAPLAEFRRRLSSRKAGPVVMVAACRKLLRLLVALVRDGKFYEAGRLGVSVAASAA